MFYINIVSAQTKNLIIQLFKDKDVLNLMGTPLINFEY